MSSSSDSSSSSFLSSSFGRRGEEEEERRRKRRSFSAVSAGEGEGEEDVFLLKGIFDECSLLGKRRYVCVIIYSERCSEELNWI